MIVVVLYFVVVFDLENRSAPFSPTSDRPLISDEQGLLGGLLFICVNQEVRHGY